MLQDWAAAAIAWVIVLPLVLWDSRKVGHERVRMLALVLFVYFVTIALLHLPHYMHALRIGNWNWSGKIVSSIFIYAALFAIPALRPARAFITLHQRPGWLPGTVIALLLIVGLQASAQFYYGGSERISAETLAFQATLPGINEEPLWRALLLGCLNTICRSRRRLSGASLGWSVIVSAVLFALGHALVFDARWHLQFDSPTFAYVMAVGLILAYVAELTGSILLPIFLHNISNLVGQAWQMARG